MTRAESALARTVLAKNLKVRKGESVVIEGWAHSLPYVSALVEETRRLGAEPLVIYEDERAWWAALAHGRPATASRISKSERAAILAADVFVYLWGPEDRPRLQKLPAAAGGAAFASNDEWYKLGRKAGLRGCRLWVGYATDLVAKPLGLDGPRWRGQLQAAGLADAYQMYSRGARIAKALRDGSSLRIRHANGTDLTLGLVGQTPRIEVGLLDKGALARPTGFVANSPAGAVVARVDERMAEGTLVANQPYLFSGARFGAGRWEFSGGRLVSLQYDDDSAKSIEQSYRTAAEGKDRPGSISIGLNPKGRRVPLFEEIESGMFSLGIGGNAFVDGTTKIDFQLFSLTRGADVEVDGVPIVRAGQVG
ncbi:MAG: aminopeptidase [Thermoplasmata archaeon]|nr:aminopeptidase [Thermoplasmata archaeon]